MPASYVVHIGAGGLALVAGYVALFAAKGSATHRASGMTFVYTMLVMCAFGAMIAVMRGVAPALNAPVAVLTAYLVVTGLTTVRPPPRGERPLAIVAMLVALAVGLAFLTFGVRVVQSGAMEDGIPAFPYFMFGVVAVLGCLGDARVLRTGALRGARRLARHLWRMSIALFIAALSFFIGQAKVIPEPLRIRPLLAVPVLLVLGTTLYWLWRVRGRQALRGITIGRAHQVAQ